MLRPALAAALVVLVACPQAACRRNRMDRLPHRVLWAWESPQDLRFLSRGEGVAFLGGELHLEGAAPRWIPRRNPLKVRPETPLLGVLRVEAGAVALDAARQEALVTRALDLLRLPGVVALQVDFDARASQRKGYAEALKALRQRMPPACPLTVTALASWCLDDPWMAEAGLEGVVDEAVPMLFRLGPEALPVRQDLASGRDFSPAMARSSLGLSTDEPLPRFPRDRRLYVFHPGPWTPQAWDRFRERLP